MAETYNEFFDEFQGVVWVQPNGPNTTVYPLLCVDTDAIAEPQGDLTVRMVRRAGRYFETANAAQGTPGLVTFDVVTYKPRQRDWLQRQVDERCPMPVYFHHSLCGRQDTFLNYDAGQVARSAFITNKAQSRTARGRAEPGATPEKTEQTYSFTAGPPAPNYWPLVETVVEVAVTTATEDSPLRDIAFCTTPQCRGACGAAESLCDDGILGADSDGASHTAPGWVTANGGGAWTLWAARPFAATYDIASVVCFDIDRDTTRWIAARGTTIGGSPAQISYSDNGGATWSAAVSVGGTNGEYFTHSGALFALDHRHIWAVTNLANVYFSADGGLTWTDQSAPAPAANEVLNYVHFIDENYGWAVGGLLATSGYYIQTTDGGAHWSLATTEPVARAGVWVAVRDAYHIWCGTDNGAVYFSDNWGTTWTARTLPVTPTQTGDGAFWDDYAGFIVGYRNVSSVPYPILFRTFNGGADWEYYQYATALSTTEYWGMNALAVCGYNEVHAVGEQLVGGHSFVWILKPAGWV